MNSIIIPTTPHLDRARGQQYHLVLSHNLTDEVTRTFYRDESASSYLILDNSAHELTSGEKIDRLLHQAKSIGADEVVLPDTLFDGPATVQGAEEALRTINTLLWTSEELGLKVELPRFMVVPQGATKIELSQCLRSLVDLVVEFRREICELPFTIGISKDYNDQWGDRDFLVHFLGREVFPLAELIDAQVHLLGWPKPLPVLGEIGVRYGKKIRTTDSARPFTYAMYGIDLAKDINAEYPKRPPGFFDRAVSPEFLPLLESNVRVYRGMCGTLS